jgi:hypothetical protein
LGTVRIASFDVVITTFDILKAKEVLIPEEYLDETSGEVSENSMGNHWLKLRRFTGNDRHSSE